MENYFLGYDFGSSSVKAALTNQTGQIVARAQYPSGEMPIDAPRSGWAEQDPMTWWRCCHSVTGILMKQAGVSAAQIKSIGIAYQMHGLVLVNQQGEVVRPAIIWCDSRAVAIGEQTAATIGEDCLEHCLNLPGNFTASKWKWVIDNEPEIAAQIHRMMLPGDFIAFKMTGDMTTTPQGLSEGILWDFKANQPARFVMEAMKIPESCLPEVVPAIGVQGFLSQNAAQELGLKPGIPVSYRSGDQPNNALSLGVLHPGQIAATAGTSGVVYSVTDQLIADPLQRINSFAHTNHLSLSPRIGLLLCINSCGILYRWMQMVAGHGFSYAEMEKKAAAIPPGSEGLYILPFGNGAERLLGNRHPGASISGIDLTRHNTNHLYRAALEGIAFAFVYGVQYMRSLGLDIREMRAGSGNLFESGIFSTTLARLLGCRIDVLDTLGAAGAAMAGAVGAGYVDALVFDQGEIPVRVRYEPDHVSGRLEEHYHHWVNSLEHRMLQENSPVMNLL